MYLKGLFKSFSRFMHPSMHCSCVRDVSDATLAQRAGGMRSLYSVKGGCRAHIARPLRHLGMLVSSICKYSFDGLQSKWLELDLRRREGRVGMKRRTSLMMAATSSWTKADSSEDCKSSIGGAGPARSQRTTKSRTWEMESFCGNERAHSTVR